MSDNDSQKLRYFEEKYASHKRYYVVGSKVRKDPNIDAVFHGRPMGYADVYSGRFVPNFDNHWKTGEQVPSVSYFGQMRDNNRELYKDGIDTIPDPDTLFTHVRPTVDTAFSHRDVRHAMPILLAHAYNQHGKLRADQSLSQHSAPLVQRAVSAGMAEAHPGNPNAEQTNDVTFEDDDSRIVSDHVMNNAIRRGSWKEISREDIATARNTVRSMLRPQKEHTQVVGGPQFEQLKLPGMEGI